MCFKTTRSSLKKIAKTNIECWKYVDEINNAYSSPYRSFIYRLKKRAKKVAIKKICHPTIKEYGIYKGYHSYKSFNIAKDEWNANGIHKFIIPKGTCYYANRKEYVSETIILVEP
jgi:hypothetical protein